MVRRTQHATVSRRRSRVLILGWQGGVGWALLGLLRRHPAGADLLAGLSELVLVDEAPTPGALPELPRSTTIMEPTVIERADDLADLVEAHAIDTVVEVAGVDTFECVLACAARGADYLSTGVDHWAADNLDRHAWQNRALVMAQDLLPDRRPHTPGSHLVGTGMNPGVVNALVVAGVDAFAERAGVPASELELHSILFTEEDTSLARDPLPPRTFAMTWNPLHCLEELLEPEAMFVRKGTIAGLGHPPHRVDYRARCGDRTVAGMAVPHDELVTVGHRYPEVELAYIYRIPDSARRVLRANADREPADFDRHKLYPPADSRALVGSDRVGALLCSRRFGELWIGFDNDAADAARYRTNATCLQVAAGLVAGWHAFGEIEGIHTVDDLDARAYLACVESMLGPAQVVHDPDAAVVSIPERRVA